MNRLITFFVVFLLSAVLFTLSGLNKSVDANSLTDDPSDRLQKAITLKDEFRDEEALKEFTFVLELQDDHYTALWYVVMLHTTIGHRPEQSRDREAHYDQAYNLAKQLLKHHPDSAGSHFAYAAAVGRKAQIAGARQRIRLSTEIREHAEKAIELDPEYARAWNLLGIWHHRAANLSRLERLAANALFGGAPEGASNTKAREAFRRAIAINPDFILFYHDQANFFLTIGEKDNARRTINAGLSLDETTSDDTRWKENMQQMLSDL